MKKTGTKIGLGVILIFLSTFTVGNINFSNAEAIGYSIVPLGLIIWGIYLIFSGIKDIKAKKQ